MKALLVSLALLASAGAAPPALAQASAAPIQAASPDIAALDALSSQWLTAYKTRDAAALDRVLADEFQGFYPGGRLMTKSDVVKVATNPGRTVESVSWEDLKIIVFGDVAVIRGRSRMSGKTAEGPFATLNDFVDVYARRGGVWKAISAHVVPVAQ